MARKIAELSSVDLVLDNGELVRVECRSEDADAIFDSLMLAMKRKDAWDAGQFEECCANYLGNPLESVNMARVVGLL